MTTKLAVLLLCGLKPSGAWAQTVPLYTTRPAFLEFLPNAFGDVPRFFAEADPRDHAMAYAGLLGLTAVLVYHDQPILDESQRFARRIHLISDKDSGTRSRLVATTQLGGIDADFRLPKGPNSYLYFIGDGLTSFSIIGGLAAYGGISDDLRALNTASQAVESVLLTGIFVICSKYSFGRQSPNQATRPGGEWHPMPGVKNYLTHVSEHDAFPSGHVATATTMVSILAYNYPDKAWIVPVGSTAIGLLGFAMLNNGVHWAGEYPLGAAIGYVAATTVFERHKPQNVRDSADTTSLLPRWLDVGPLISQGGIGLNFDFQIFR